MARDEKLSERERLRLLRVVQGDDGAPGGQELEAGRR
jgi:hypothetical protein